MREFLIFRLYGMMASWGDIAVGELRPTFDHPSRSAIVGLLAAALGIRRDEEERLSILSNTCRIAIRVDAPGVLLRDAPRPAPPPPV
ncbi:MAG TPA: type I-E CRISPR-associated protein Cas5/CasD, partial [Methanoculleus sp.]|nr:type I-E CRISPR-associated protein Cas5/CasD [Methanoculleus sp.]